MTTRPADPTDSVSPADDRPDRPAVPAGTVPAEPPVATPTAVRGRAARYVGRHRRSSASDARTATSAGPVASIQHALPSLCAGVLVVALLTAPAATIPSTGQAPSCPGPAGCGNGPDGAAPAGVEEAAAVARAAAGRDCVPTTSLRPGTMPSGAVVRDAGSTRVGWLPFDEAWHRTADGRAWTLRYCYDGGPVATP